jgi:hypothetical protein
MTRRTTRSERGGKEFDSGMTQDSHGPVGMNSRTFHIIPDIYEEDLQLFWAPPKTMDEEL